MDEPQDPQDALDKNISKLVRGARPVEPARKGAQERVFGSVMNRLGATQRKQAKSQFWTVTVAVAACFALGAVLFSQFFAKRGPEVGYDLPRAPKIKMAVPPVNPVTPTPAPSPELAAAPQVQQIETADDQTAQRKLSDGTSLDVAASSRVEILNFDDKTRRPEVRIRSGEVTLDIPRSSSSGSGRVLIHSTAGDVLATGAQVKVAVSKNAPVVLKQNGENPLAAQASAAPKLAMNVAVIRGEAILREAIGNERLVLAGETATVGGQSETSSAVAENWRSGQLLPKLEDGTQGAPLEVRRHTVKASITEQIALVEVDEVFYNPGNQRIEGTFVFPLPHDSTICRLAMYVGDNLMEGEIAEAQRARRTFEALKVQQVDPALLEWAGGNTFKMRIFPIEAKSEKRVLISYYEVLKKDHGRINFTYPLMSDATQQSAVGEVSVAVTVDSTPEVTNPAVPGYDSATIKPAPHHLDVAYSAKATRPDKDFTLQYQSAKGAPLVTVPFWHARRNEGYFVMIFSPDLEQTSSDKHRPSDFVFVVDKSGGLGARQLALAVRTVKGALSYLTPNDHFSIVAYDTAAKKFQPQLVAATPQSVSEASAWLDGLEAFGASDLSPAWKAAAELSSAGTTQIVYCGSGLSTLSSTQSGKLLADADAALTGKDVRVHCLPLGAVQDLTFLNELAKKYSGTVRPIKDADDATLATSELLEDFAWPLYKNVQLMFDGFQASEVYPLVLPNVTAGRQLFVFGKYAYPVECRVKLSASRDGEPFEYVGVVHLSTDASNNFVPKLWATQRIAQLQLDAAAATPDDAKNIVNDVVETSKRYRVMSQYTSFLVLETPEDYLRYGIERRPDEFDPNASQDVPTEVMAQLESRQNSFKDGKFASNGNDDAKGAATYRAREVESLREARKSVGDELKRLEPAAGENRRAASESQLAAAAPTAPMQKQLQERGKQSNADKAGEQMEKAAAMDAAAMPGITNGPVDRFGGARLRNVETLAWERQDIFPLIERFELPNWNTHQAHSTDNALKILKGLQSRFDSLSLSVFTYTLDKDGKEVQQGHERTVTLDFATRAFISQTIGADFADVCDGKTYVRLFPQLKYAARRNATDSDLLALGNTLPGYLLPWADKLDFTYTISVDQDTDAGVILRLADRNNPNRYTLLYLATKTGPLTRIETFDRRRVANDFKFVKIETVLCEEVETAGDFKLPTTFRTIQHGDKDVVSAVVRIKDLKANAKLNAEQFKAELNPDWAVRDQDAAPAGNERKTISPPVNPSPNFGPRRN